MSSDVRLVLSASEVDGGLFDDCPELGPKVVTALVMDHLLEG